MRVMGLDVGQARIGVAVTDPLGKIAQPLETIKRDGSELDRIAELVEATGSHTIVVGLPLLMDGSEGFQAGLVRDFTTEIRRKIDINIVFIDERLTTKQAEAVMRKADGKAYSPGDSDRVAAALILMTYMDRESKDTCQE